MSDENPVDRSDEEPLDSSMKSGIESAEEKGNKSDDDRRPDSSTDRVLPCPICHEKLKGPVGNPECCDHVFCLKCIRTWAQNTNRCPLDRLKFDLLFVRKSSSSPTIARRIPVQDCDLVVDNIPFTEADANLLEDACQTCGQGTDPAVLLLCDSCSLAFHTYCLVPALSNVPDGDWFCPNCRPALMDNGYSEVPLSVVPELRRTSRRQRLSSDTEIETTTFYVVDVRGNDDSDEDSNEEEQEQEEDEEEEEGPELSSGSEGNDVRYSLPSSSTTATPRKRPTRKIKRSKKSRKRPKRRKGRFCRKKVNRRIRLQDPEAAAAAESRARLITRLRIVGIRPGFDVPVVKLPPQGINPPSWGRAQPRASLTVGALGGPSTSELSIFDTEYLTPTYEDEEAAMVSTTKSIKLAPRSAAATAVPVGGGSGGGADLLSSLISEQAFLHLPASQLHIRPDGRLQQQQMVARPSLSRRPSSPVRKPADSTTSESPIRRAVLTCEGGSSGAGGPSTTAATLPSHQGNDHPSSSSSGGGGGTSSGGAGVGGNSGTSALYDPFHPTSEDSAMSMSPPDNNNGSQQHPIENNSASNGLSGSFPKQPSESAIKPVKSKKKTTSESEGSSKDRRGDRSERSTSRKDNSKQNNQTSSDGNKKRHLQSVVEIVPPHDAFNIDLGTKLNDDFGIKTAQSDGKPGQNNDSSSKHRRRGNPSPDDDRRYHRKHHNRRESEEKSSISSSRKESRARVRSWSRSRSRSRSRRRGEHGGSNKYDPPKTSNRSSRRSRSRSRSRCGRERDRSSRRDRHHGASSSSRSRNRRSASPVPPETSFHHSPMERSSKRSKDRTSSSDRRSRREEPAKDRKANDKDDNKEKKQKKKSKDNKKQRDRSRERDRSKDQSNNKASDLLSPSRRDPFAMLSAEADAAIRSASQPQPASVLPQPSETNCKQSQKPEIIEQSVTQPQLIKSILTNPNPNLTFVQPLEVDPASVVQMITNQVAPTQAGALPMPAPNPELFSAPPPPPGVWPQPMMHMPPPGMPFIPPNLSQPPPPPPPLPQQQMVVGETNKNNNSTNNQWTHQAALVAPASQSNLANYTNAPVVQQQQQQQQQQHQPSGQAGQGASGAGPTPKSILQSLAALGAMINKNKGVAAPPPPPPKSNKTLVKENSNPAPPPPPPPPPPPKSNKKDCNSNKPAMHISAADDDLTISSNSSEDVPTSAVDMQNKQAKKAGKQMLKEVEDCVKKIIKPHYVSGKLDKDGYKTVMKKCVTKILAKKPTHINEEKVKIFVDAYLDKVFAESRKRRHRHFHLERPDSMASSSSETPGTSAPQSKSSANTSNSLSLPPLPPLVD